MFNIKIYDINNSFRTTLSEKKISSNFSFSWTVWSWFSSFKFDYYWNYNIQHRDRIKIFKEWNIIYHWYVTWIQRVSDRSWNKMVVSVYWNIWLLAYVPWNDWTYSDNPWNLIRSIFSSVWWFNTDFVLNYPSLISLQSLHNTALSFLQEILKITSDYWLFINANNEVLFWPYEIGHILTYWKEVFWIEIVEDSSEYYNKFRINYSWWNIIEWNDEKISIYWESYLVVNDSSIKNYATAQERMHSLFSEYAIKKTIRVKVNKSCNYYNFLPWEVVSVRNSNWIIENKPIKQINYWKDSATLILESYSALENFIK
jgi:hypothetical protein